MDSEPGINKEPDTSSNNRASITFWGICVTVGVLIILSIIFMFIYPKYLSLRKV